MKKIKSLSLIFSILLVSLGVFIPNQKVKAEEVVMCIMDAFLCPDGTWVGRTGPNCEFICPEKTTKQTEDTQENIYKIDKIIEKIKNKREDFKIKFDDANSGILNIDDSPIFGSEKISDINKKNSILKIIKSIQELNTKYVKSLSTNINKIEDILAKVDTKIGETKEYSELKDTAELEEKSIELNKKIDLIREEIIKQAETRYTLTVTDENLIKDQIKIIRNSFKERISTLFTTAREIKSELRSLALMLVQDKKDENGVVVDESVVEIINNIDKE